MKKVQKLMKEFDANLDLYERPKYKIIEMDRQSYILHSMITEYEDGALYFGDDENILLIKNSILNELLCSKIKDIIIQSKKYTIELSNEFGQVSIELV